jgi:hypothetical protein
MSLSRSRDARAPRRTPMGWRPHIVFFVRARYSPNASCESAALKGGRESNSMASWSSRLIDSCIGCEAVGAEARVREIAGTLLGEGSG